MIRPLLSFDIETVKHEKIEDWVPKPEVALVEPDLDSVAAPKNYKDPEKIKEYVKQRSADLIADAEAEYAANVVKAEEEYQELLDNKGPLDSDLGRIRAIGWQLYPSETPVNTFVVPEDGTEEELLEIFWKHYRMSGGKTIGFNHRRFDLPFLMRRSFDLRVPPEKVFLAKYRIDPLYDLYEILNNWEWSKGPISKGLKFLVKRYGLDNPLPDFAGDLVSEMTEMEVRAYVANDIYIQTQLFQKMDGYYWPSLAIEHPELQRPQEVEDYLAWLNETTDTSGTGEND